MKFLLFLVLAESSDDTNNRINQQLQLFFTDELKIKPRKIVFNFQCRQKQFYLFGKIKYINTK